MLQFPGGHANLTYLLRFGSRELVLRRPPFGPVAPGSHDMVREHKVLSRLWEYFAPAPRAYLLCEDESVIGARFFVMERRRGVVARLKVPEELAHHEDVARRVSFALVDAMAELHAVDYEKAGLADLGRPEGFAARQLAGWKKRFELAKDAPLPRFDEVHARLASTLPAASRASLVHNDLKLDNCQFDPADPDRVASIFDWDMTTLGDPLVDLGTLLGYWAEPDDSADRSPTNALTNQPGFPTRRELAERYAARCDVPLERIQLVRGLRALEDRRRAPADLHPLRARPDPRRALPRPRPPRPHPRRAGGGDPRGRSQRIHCVTRGATID